MGTDLSPTMSKFQSIVLALLEKDYSVEELKDLIEELKDVNNLDS